MSKPKKESILKFVDRCLTNAKTGQIYLCKRDQERLRKEFASIGRDVRLPFNDEEELLRRYFDTLNEIDSFMLIEHFRLYKPGQEDPLDDLAGWTDMSRRQYLVIRLVSKLNYLNVDLNDLTNWVREHVGARYVNLKDQIAFEDEERMLELDRILEARIAAAPRPVEPETKE